MYRVVDYILQSQGRMSGAPELRVLDSRGGGSVASSFPVLFSALAKLVMARVRGELGGLHVHMAERLSVPRKGALIMMARLLGVPVILHLHAAQMEQFYAGRGRFLQAGIRYIFSLPDAVIVLGERARKFVVEQLHVPAAKVDVLINGVPGPAIAPVRTAPEGPLHLVFLGNLTERKGVSDLLAALATPQVRARSWHATFAGGGDVDSYRAKAAALQLDDRISFPGWMSQEQARLLVSQADTLILPSYDEGLPLVILEALAHAVPVICTPVGEIPQVLQHGETAYFVEAGNVEQLSGAVLAVLDDAQLRQRLSIAGRLLYERVLSIDVFCRNLMVIYNKTFDMGRLTQRKELNQTP